MNGTTGPVLNEYPGRRWAQIAEICESRGGEAVLERRVITTADILPLLTDRSGWLELGAQVVSPWETWAQLELLGCLPTADSSREDPRLLPMTKIQIKIFFKIMRRQETNDD